MYKYGKELTPRPGSTYQTFTKTQQGDIFWGIHYPLVASKYRTGQFKKLLFKVTLFLIIELSYTLLKLQDFPAF